MTRPPTPWVFTVDELVAAGIDDVGVFQPLLRPRNADGSWPVRRLDVIDDLAARGLLTPDGDGWAPAQQLATVMLTRASSTSVAVVTVRRDPAEERSYLLGGFAGPEGLLRLVVAADTATVDFLDRSATAAAVGAAVLSGARVTIDVQRLVDPDIPMRRVRVRLGAVDEREHTTVVVGVRRGEDTDSWESRLDLGGVVELCRRALVGEDATGG
jgi:hypothetical protein